MAGAGVRGDVTAEESVIRLTQFFFGRNRAAGDSMTCVWEKAGVLHPSLHCRGGNIFNPWGFWNG